VSQTTPSDHYRERLHQKPFTVDNQTNQTLTAASFLALRAYVLTAHNLSPTALFTHVCFSRSEFKESYGNSANAKAATSTTAKLAGWSSSSTANQPAASQATSKQPAEACDPAAAVPASSSSSSSSKACGPFSQPAIPSPFDSMR
jgi:hypothetical protein